MDGVVVCENCKENYSSSLSNCPKCGFSRVASNNNSSQFNIRNPFLELSSTASQVSVENNSNNSFLIDSSINNNSFSNNHDNIAVPSVNNSSVPNSNAILNNNVGINDNSNNLIPNAISNPVVTDNTLPTTNVFPATDNNPVVSEESLPVEQSVEPQNSNVDNNEQKIEEVNNFVNQSDYIKSMDTNKYQVSGIDFDSFFDNSKEPTTEESSFNNILAASNEVEQVNSSEPSSETVKTDDANTTYNPALDFEKDRLEQIRKEENDKIANETKSKKSFDFYTIYKYEFLLIALVSLAVIVISCLSIFNVIYLVHGISIIAFLVLAYRFASLRKKEAGFIGLFVAALMIATIIYKDYVNFIFGMFLFTSSITYVFRFKK